MAKSWDAIDNGWLRGNKLALEATAVVEAFDRVERVFGREWIEAYHTSFSGTPCFGTAPTLHVVITGQLIASLDGVIGAA